MKKVYTPFVLFLVKKGMNRLSVSEKLIVAERIINSMTDNPNFTNPVPTLANFTAIVNELKDAEAAMDGSKVRTNLRNTALAVFNASVNQLQAYVENVADGNTEVILSSGFELRNRPTKPVLPEIPELVSAKAGVLTGELLVKWKRNTQARFTMVEITRNPGTDSWMPAGQTTGSKIVLSSYDPTQLYFVRVAHVNKVGMGPWSEWVQGRPSF